MPHSNYLAFNRLVWNKHTNSFELITRASYKKNKKTRTFVMDVCKMTSNGKVYFRNMIKYTLTPWLLIHPNDVIAYYGSKPYGKDKKWWECSNKTGLYAKTRQTKEMIESLVEKYEPKFIYTLKAYNNNFRYWLKELYNIYKMWKQYPQDCEMLVKLGYYYLATQKQIYKLSKNKKQAIIKCLVKDHPYGSSATYCDIQEYMLGIDNSYLFRQCKKSKPLYDYITKQNIGVDFYFDYIKAVKEIDEKRLNDKYWKFPKNLLKAHNKVMGELNNIRQARELERQEQLAKKQLENAKQYENDLATIPQHKAVINGFSLFLANSIADIKEQAEKLEQCLITMKYYEKVAEKTSLLIFIRNDKNEPIATCEIGYDKTIKQFYADEHDRNNCQPTQEQKDLVNSYMSHLIINQRTKTIKYAN